MKQIIDDLKPAGSIQISKAKLSSNSILGFMVRPADWKQHCPTAPDVAYSIGSSYNLADLKQPFTVVTIIEPVADSHPGGPGGATYTSYRAKNLFSVEVGKEFSGDMRKPVDAREVTMKDVVGQLMNCGVDVYLFDGWADLNMWALEQVKS